LTYNPRLAKVKVDPHAKNQGQTVQTGECAQTTRHTRTRTLPNVLSPLHGRLRLDGRSTDADAVCDADAKMKNIVHASYTCVYARMAHGVETFEETNVIILVKLMDWYVCGSQDADAGLHCC